MVAGNQRYVFYALKDYRNNLKRGGSEEEWEERKEKALHPLLLSWSGGFSSLEGTQENNWRWCSHEGVLVFHNPTARPRKVEVAMTLATGYEELADMVISGDLFAEKLRVNSRGSPLKKAFIVPPGRHEVKFRTGAKRSEALSDPRTLVFRVNNFHLQELN
jgi:hypothetical protein